MNQRFLIVLVSLVLFSGVAVVASELEPVDIHPDSTAVLIEQTNESEQLMSTNEIGENLLSGIVSNWSNGCTSSSCDYSVDCYETCEAQHPNQSEDGDNGFCWCLRACSEICIF